MPRKRISEVLHQVDPNLRIVEARPRPSKKYTKMSSADWEKAAGGECRNCGRETLQLINGLCPQCSRAVEAETDRQIENRAMRNYYQDKRKRGTLNLHRMREGLP